MEEGAHLVEIFNRNELDFIRQEAKNIGNHVAWDYWIGLRKEAGKYFSKSWKFASGIVFGI